MTRAPAGWDVDSPVQAEVLVVWLDGDRLALTGPDGPQPWILQLGLADHPVVAAELPAPWRPLLAAYVPEPFRSLG